jgi:hypothetical protein
MSLCTFASTIAAAVQHARASSQPNQVILSATKAAPHLGHATAFALTVSLQSAQTDEFVIVTTLRQHVESGQGKIFCFLFGAYIIDLAVSGFDSQCRSGGMGKRGARHQRFNRASPFYPSIPVT